MVLVRKKDGTLRLCCDFRRLNKKTIADKHPLPRVQSTLDSLGGSKWFSVLDQSRAYYQGFVREEDRHKTSFVTPWGLYQWVRIPFGLTNAPATFQRYMEETVGEFRDQFAIPYIDDVIVYSTSFDDHLGHLRLILRRTRERGLKLNLKKCKFFQSCVKFLGRIVDETGYRMDNDNIKAATALTSFIPKNVGDVRHILGLLGYHRRHIQDFSSRAKPISDLLVISRNKDKCKDSSKNTVIWTAECQSALESLVNNVTSPPILAYPDFQKESILHTDASSRGIGCILYQKHEGKMRVIGYGSRTLRKAEENYHSTKLEFLALKWAITEVFRDYLAYATYFGAFTDNNPLVYLMEANKLHAYGERWVSELAEYNFSIKYRPGIINRDADCLSRLPLDIDNYMTLCTEEITPDAFTAIMSGLETKCQGNETWRLHVSSASINKEVEAAPKDILANIEKLKEGQSKDPDISFMINCINYPSVSVSKRKVMQADSKALKTLKRGFKKLKISKEGLLMMKTKQDTKVVLPKSMHYLIYEHLHIEMGHLGAERVTELAKKRVYWPQMQHDIETFIATKCLCIVQRRPHLHAKAPLQNIYTSMPMELVTIDYVHLDKGVGGMEYLLVIVDHFSRFAHAYPTKNKSALTAAKRLYGDFILRFGIPSRFMSDQGGEFENRLMQELNKLCGITKSRTTPYHPQSNGTCERMNQTLLKMLRTLPESQKSRWPEFVNKMVHSYNCTQHSSTGYSPYYLLFGREPKLPLDLLLCTKKETEDVNHHQYARNWKLRMQQAYEIARKKVANRKGIDKKRWDSRPVLSQLKIGDRVLLQNKKEHGGTGKLRSFWEHHIYVVKTLKGEHGVVYEIQEEGNESSKPRVVHRNMLMPIEDEFIMEPVEFQKSTSRSTTSSRKLFSKQVLSYPEEEDEHDSDDETGFYPCQLIEKLRPLSESRDDHRNDGEDVNTNGELVSDIHMDRDNDFVEEQLTESVLMNETEGNEIVIPEIGHSTDAEQIDTEEQVNEDNVNEESGSETSDICGQNENSIEVDIGQTESSKLHTDADVYPATRSRVSRMNNRSENDADKREKRRSRSRENRRERQAEVRDQKRSLPKSKSSDSIQDTENWVELSPVKDAEEPLDVEKHIQEWKKKKQESLRHRTGTGNTKRTRKSTLYSNEKNETQTYSMDQQVADEQDTYGTEVVDGNSTSLDNPDKGNVRHSTRNRKVTQKFGYDAMGQPQMNQISVDESRYPEHVWTFPVKVLPQMIHYHPCQELYWCAPWYPSMPVIWKAYVMHDWTSPMNTDYPPLYPLSCQYYM